MIRTRSLMKTADYTVHKPVSRWVIHVEWLKNILVIFKWQKCHDIQLQSFTVRLKGPQKRVKPPEAKMGVLMCHSAERCHRPLLHVEKEHLLYICIHFLSSERSALRNKCDHFLTDPHLELLCIKGPFCWIHTFLLLSSNPMKRKHSLCHS